MPKDSVTAENVTPEQRESARKDEQLAEHFRECFGDNVRRFRTHMNWTQGELADRVGLCTSQIGFYERKTQSVSLKYLIRFASLVNVSPMELLNGPIFFEEGEDSKEYKGSAGSLGATRSAISHLERSNVKRISSNTDNVLLEETSFGHKLAPSSPTTKSAEALASMEDILGSPNDPLSLAVVSRIVSAAHKRIESLRHKHGSVPMTRAMLHGVLAAILNASHDADDEGESANNLQPEVET